jgi:4a-hydroxytetrahydrobiopterin dehydratase
MESLSTLHCTPCDASQPQLTLNEINELLLKCPGWQLVNEVGINQLTQTFLTKNYTRSMLFTNSVATLADTVNHHPKMIVEYGSVTVVWWSHNIKGLHKNDFIMAAKTSELF